MSLTWWSLREYHPVLKLGCTAWVIGNYNGHMAYAAELPFCVAYPLEFINKKDPATGTFRNADNHPVTFMRMEMIICQLLVWDCPEHEYVRTNCNGCLTIPRGMQFGKELFPEIVIPWNHAAPYCDPNTRKEAPFITVGPFYSTWTPSSKVSPETCNCTPLRRWCTLGVQVL